MYYSFYIFMPVILGLTVLFNAQTLRIIKHKKNSTQVNYSNVLIAVDILNTKYKNAHSG